MIYNGITIGSIASELVMGGFDNMLKPLIAMIVYTIVIIILSKLASTSLTMRNIIDGHPVVLFENDQIYNETFGYCCNNPYCYSFHTVSDASVDARDTV